MLKKSTYYKLTLGVATVALLASPMVSGPVYAATAKATANSPGEVTQAPKSTSPDLTKSLDSVQTSLTKAPADTTTLATIFGGTDAYLMEAVVNSYNAAKRPADPVGTADTITAYMLRTFNNGFGVNLLGPETLQGLDPTKVSDWSKLDGIGAWNITYIFNTLNDYLTFLGTAETPITGNVYTGNYVFMFDFPTTDLSMIEGIALINQAHLVAENIQFTFKGNTSDLVFPSVLNEVPADSLRINSVAKTVSIHELNGAPDIYLAFSNMDNNLDITASPQLTDLALYTNAGVFNFDQSFTNLKNFKLTKAAGTLPTNYFSDRLLDSAGNIIGTTSLFPSIEHLEVRFNLMTTAAALPPVSSVIMGKLNYLNLEGIKVADFNQLDFASADNLQKLYYTPENKDHTSKIADLTYDFNDLPSLTYVWLYGAAFDRAYPIDHGLMSVTGRTGSTLPNRNEPFSVDQTTGEVVIDIKKMGFGFSSSKDATDTTLYPASAGTKARLNASVNTDWEGLFTDLVLGTDYTVDVGQGIVRLSYAAYLNAIKDSGHSSMAVNISATDKIGNTYTTSRATIPYVPFDLKPAGTQTSITGVTDMNLTADKDTSEFTLPKIKVDNYTAGTELQFSHTPFTNSAGKVLNAYIQFPAKAYTGEAKSKDGNAKGLGSPYIADNITSNTAPVKNYADGTSTTLLTFNLADTVNYWNYLTADDAQDNLIALNPSKVVTEEETNTGGAYTSTYTLAVVPTVAESASK